MNKTTNQLATGVLGLAVALGFLADALLRQHPWGVNFPIWIAVLALGIGLVSRKSGAALAKGTVPLLALMGAMALGFAWRDSPVLRALDFLAVMTGGALVLLQRRWPVWQARMLDLARAGFALAGHCAAGFAHLLIREVDWSGNDQGGLRGRGRSAVVGALLAAPLLLVFGALFVAADASFENFVSQIVTANLWTHLLPIAVGTWVSAGYARAVLAGSDEPKAPPVGGQWFSIGGAELNVALALVNGLFASFVVVQAQYLFGSAGMVAATQGITFSSYARRGFFELVTVALLVLPMLLGADWLFRAGDAKKLFRSQALLLVAFVGFVLASAWHRMRLYQLEYGLTEQRFYTVAFMFWLAAVFGWFCLSVLRGRRERFLGGGLAAGFATILVLHVVNPDGWIARTNLMAARWNTPAEGAAAVAPSDSIPQGRTSSGQRIAPLDAAYLNFLSADAVPVVLENFGRLTVAEQKAYAGKQSAALEKAADWRSFNLSRAAARKALAAK